MIRDILNAILIVAAGFCNYVAIISSFSAAGPGEPEPAHPALASILTIAGITVFLVALIRLYQQKKYWWLAIVLTMILSIAAIMCLLPEANG